MKTQRHAALLRVVRRERVGSQEQLRALLKGLALSPEFFNTSTQVQEASASQTKLASSP